MTQTDIKVWLGAEGVLRVDLASTSNLTIEILELSNKLHMDVYPGRLPILLKGPRVSRVGYDVQRFAAGSRISENTAALGIVTESLIAKHLAQMFMWYHSPPYPVKLFSDETAAIRWLKRYTEHNTLEKTHPGMKSQPRHSD